ncbi:MAG: TetR/AcrR family transcriptional regulator [Thermomicrobiales bacterium]
MSNETLTARRREIIDRARGILESEGRDALTMRRLAEEIGIRAPSLYKHFPDKRAVEIAVIEIGFLESADALEAGIAIDDARSPLQRLATAYRAYALAHPHLYRLMTEDELPRNRLTPGIEERGAEPLIRLVPNVDRARAIWAFAHGMIILELEGRFPPGADLDAAWEVGITALGNERPSPTAVGEGKTVRD